MNLLLFGSTGMIGQGALRECLADSRVDRVVAIVRRASLPPHAKLAELVLPDLCAIDTIADRLSGFDACLFCAGVTSAGLTERAYTHQTYDLTLRVAALLARLNRRMTSSMSRARAPIRASAAGSCGRA